jgi:hypothetical protein
MLSIAPGSPTSLRAGAGLALLLACALLASSASGQAYPVDSSPDHPLTSHGGAFQPDAYGPAWPLASEPLPPTRSVLVTSSIPQGRAIHLAEAQEELPLGVRPVPLPPIEDELPLILEDCGCATCLPGQFHHCPPCFASTRIGRFLWAIHREACCADPCYDPHWWALADTAFFTGAARPVSQQRFRWDAGYDLIFPDRAEYFWARSGGGGLGPAATPNAIRYHELSMYTEIAAGKFSMFTDLPYRSEYPDNSGHTAGFSDMTVGTKSMLHDSELMQVTFQMTTYIPIGVAGRGLGTGHVSLEPSLIFGLNVSRFGYLQAQVAEWIPLGGNPDYAGALLRFHTSYNHSLAGSPDAIHLLGNFELNGWGFQDGAYTSPTLGPNQPANDYVYLSAGPGLRLVVCDAIDFGAGSAFALTSDHWAERLIRTELRIRY